MSLTPSLSLALRWLCTDSGLSEPELALRSGISPGAVAAYLHRPHAPSLTWLTLLSALRCRLEVKAPKRFLPIALPRITATRRQAERARWATRRLGAFRAQLIRQRADLDRRTIEQTAQSYVAASAARLDQELTSAIARLESTRVDHACSGLRSAIRHIATSASVNAEDLALLSGLSLSAAQAVLDEADDGRLATPHRLFSALAARLVIQPAGGGTISIDLAAPGDWRPEAPRPGQSSLTHEQIRARADRGESLASIARVAGVSRQRVHAIVRKVTP